MQITRCHTDKFRRVHLLCSKLLAAVDDNLSPRHTIASQHKFNLVIRTNAPVLET